MATFYDPATIQQEGSWGQPVLGSNIEQYRLPVSGGGGTPTPTGGGTSYQYGGWYPNPGAGGQVMRWFNGTWTTGGEPGGGGDPGGGDPGGGGGETDVQRREREAREGIESGYSSYFTELDAMLNEGLPAQRTAQEGIVTSQYGQGVGELGAQKEEGMGLLGRERERTQTGQARNLKDISANLRNAFMAGQVFLGARGAGDSSAANQYAYALTKLGSRQRGDIMTKTSDIMGEIGDRESRLQNIYTSETNKLGSERDQKILSIASWFAEQQNAIRQAKATGQISKGQDLAGLSQNLLNIAMQELNKTQQESSNRRAALEQWAMNNSTTIQQLKQNMQGIQSYRPDQPQSQPIVGQPVMGAGGGFNVPGAYYPGAGAKEEEKPLFGKGALGYTA